MKSIMCAVALLTVSAAFAESPVSVSNNGTLDLDTVLTVKPYATAYRQAWLTFTEENKRAKELWRFNCAAQRVTVMHVITYPNGGKAMISKPYPDALTDAKSAPVAPGSVGWTAMEFLCT